MNIKKTLLLSFILITTLLAGCVGKPVQPNPTAISADPPLGDKPTATLPPIETPTNTPPVTAMPTLGIGSMRTGVDGMTLLYVPEGEFIMGSNDGAPNEKPVHTVYLDAYWIDQTEVTNAMYSLCVESGKCIDHSEAIHKANPNIDTSRYANPLYANYAVGYVSWEDAAAYCEWAGRRLPTEAEWEKAATWDDKTKTKSVYPWGNISDCSFANYGYDRKNKIYCWTDSPVKSYESGKSPYGAYDMAGNISEWVNDWYSETYYKNSPSLNPLGPDSGLERSSRDSGGDSYHIRSARRSGDVPGFHDSTTGFHSTGFRCAQSANKITADQTPLPTAAGANTPYPTTTPTSFHVQPATNQGDRFTATTEGIYRFTMEKGAIRICPPDSNLPDCGMWNSQLIVYKNRVVLWGSYENKDLRVAANLFPVRSDWGISDYTIGVNYFSTDLALVEKANKGHYIDISLKKGDYLIFIPYDCQSCFGDNEGSVDISVSIIGALP
jgi:formylglycine-generating enzyme required for sulfatase activity